MPDPSKPSAPLRALVAGLLLLAISALITLTPLLAAHRSTNRYIVAFGIAGVLLGASFILHGTWDYLASRRR